jgi:hypothetical protein
MEPGVPRPTYLFRFGTKALNLDHKFMLGMMRKVMNYVNEQMAKGVSSDALIHNHPG